MNRFLFLALAVLTVSAQNDQKGSNVEQADPYDIDFRIETLNKTFSRMDVGESLRFDLADDSYYTLAVPEQDKLVVTAMFYNPADQTHNKGYEGTYRFDEKINTLVSVECKPYEPPILPPTIDPLCEKGIIHATEMISLQLQGSIDMENYDVENLEDCVGNKLTPKIIEKPYLKCFLKIVGDEKYSKEALDAKIKEYEAKGFTCEPDGTCYEAEDPEVLQKILEGLRGEPVPIDVPNDDRPRYCDLRTIPVVADSESVTTKYVESFEQSCTYWVNRVYCKNVGNRLFWAVDYIDSNGHTNTLHTGDFNKAEADKMISVPWEAGVRISKLHLFMDPRNLTVKDLQLDFNKTKLPVSCAAPNAPSRLSMTHAEINIKGEIGGFHFARMAGGVRVKSVIERT